MRGSLLPLLLELSELSNFYYPRSTMLEPYRYSYRPLSLWALDTDRVTQGISITKDGFQMNLDVQNFAPNEISVKTIDNDIIIEGKQDERKDEEGSLSRQFTRRVSLPKGYDINSLTSTLSSDQILTIKAPPLPESEQEEKVRHIQIQQTGPARLNVNKEERNENENKVDERKDTTTEKPPK